MSLIPPFEVGVSNAWIFMLCDMLLIPFFLLVARSRSIAPEKRQLAVMSRTKKIVFYSSKAIYLPALIYSIFLPLKLGTLWFYLGLPICLSGLTTGTITLINWAATPPGQPVIGGLYRYSRHPGYLSSFLVYLGVGIASASWIFLLFSIVFTAALFYFVSIEEQLTLEKYSDSYREYISKTPRYLTMWRSQKQ